MSDSSLQSLRQMLKSADPAQRRKAVMTLGSLRDPRAKAALEQIAKRDPSESVRGLAAAMLGQSPDLPDTPDLPEMSNGSNMPKLSSAPSSAPAGKSSALTGGGQPTGRGFTANGNAWDCPMCGATENTTAACAYCGEPRPAGAAANAPSADFPAPREKQQLRSDALTDEVVVIDPTYRNFALGLTQTLPQQSVMSCTTLFIIPFVLSGVLLLFSAVNEWLRYTHLTQSGVKAAAQIVEKYTDTDSEGDTTYHVKYSFTVGQQTYTGSGSVGYSEYTRLEKGSRIPIVYYSANPSESALASRANDMTMPVMVTLFAGGNLLVCFLFFWGMASQADRRNYLSKHGKLIDGEIVRVTLDTDSDDDEYAEIHYRFIPPTGRVIERSVRSYRSDIRSNAQLLRGCRVKILYADDRRFMLL